MWIIRSDELYHHGIKGQKWGVRRYRNKDGTLTSAGKKKAEVEWAKRSARDTRHDADRRYKEVKDSRIALGYTPNDVRQARNHRDVDRQYARDVVRTAKAKAALAGSGRVSHPIKKQAAAYQAEGLDENTALIVAKRRATSNAKHATIAALGGIGATLLAKHGADAVMDTQAVKLYKAAAKGQRAIEKNFDKTVRYQRHLEVAKKDPTGAYYTTRQRRREKEAANVNEVLNRYGYQVSPQYYNSR